MNNEVLARKIAENKFSYKNSFTLQGNFRSVKVTEFFFKEANDNWLMVWIRDADLPAFLKEPEKNATSVFWGDFNEKSPVSMANAPMWSTPRAKGCRKVIETTFKDHYELSD